MDSLEGHFLCASARLTDNNFVRTVILLIQHNEQGALGVVVNRPTSKLVKELWREVGEARCESELPVYLGGPVSGPLMALHTDESLAEVEIVPGVFFAAKKQNLDQLVRQSEHTFRMFVGHAGWGPGQLESEIEQGAWLTAPATPEYIFYEEPNVWEEVTKSVGMSLLKTVLKIKDIPTDPSLN